MIGRITILGCGSSGGVPRIGQGWGACDPHEPRNRRLRCSILIERVDPDSGTTCVLVDTSPDLRQQLLATGTQRLDAIVFTHPHADHTHGIDDVRPLVLHMRSRITAYMDDMTEADIKAKFSYIFETPPGSLYPPLLDSGRIVAGKPVEFDGPGGPLRITGFELGHGEINALGLEVGRVAYTPDLNSIPDSSRSFLDGLDLWIIDALRYKPHPSHFSLDEALDWIARCKPRRAVLTNLHTDLDYATLGRMLPQSIEVAYDGMVLDFDL